MATFTSPPSSTYLEQLRYQNAVRSVGSASRSAAQTFKFYVEVQGILIGEFLECGGLVIEREVFEYEEGGVNDYVHKLPGRMKQQNITLKRGITYDRGMWDWFRKGTYDGRVKRKNLSIIVGNAEGRKVKQWDIYDAFPIKWSGADLSTTDLSVAAETIEIAHHGMSLSAEEGNPLGSGFNDLPVRAPQPYRRPESTGTFWELDGAGPPNGITADTGAGFHDISTNFSGEAPKPIEPDIWKLLLDKLKGPPPPGIEPDIWALLQKEYAASEEPPAVTPDLWALMAKALE